MLHLRHEVSAYIEPFFVDTGKVFCCPPVMGFATADVAGLDVDGCLLCHKFTLFKFHNGLLGQSLNRWVQGEGHFLLRVLRGGSH